MKREELSRQIICGFYNVYNKLGYGFLENVYEKALLIELQKGDIAVERQHAIKVMYEGHVVGEYFADLLIENKIILEIKATKHIAPEHEAQLLNYLKATEMEIGLLLNFGPRPEIKRKVFDNKIEI